MPQWIHFYLEWKYESPFHQSSLHATVDLENQSPHMVCWFALPNKDEWSPHQKRELSTLKIRFCRIWPTNTNGFPIFSFLLYLNQFQGWAHGQLNENDVLHEKLYYCYCVAITLKVIWILGWTHSLGSSPLISHHYFITFWPLSWMPCH